MKTLENQLSHLPIITVGDTCQKCGAKRDEGASTRPPWEPNPADKFRSCNIDESGNVTNCGKCSARMQ